MTLAVAIFALALAAIASERVHRTKVALLGAALVVVTQTIEQEQAIEAVDFNTIGLLAGMMVMVKLTETTGVYTWLAIRAGQLSQGRPLAIVVSLAVTTAVLSAFLDNLTTILLMVPITFLLADALDIDPLPLVIIEVIASNIGGTATLIGDPPNILIGSATGLDFVAFATNLAPVVVLLLVLMVGGFWVFYGRRERLGFPSAEGQRALAEADVRVHLGDRRLLRRALGVLALTVLGFILHGVLHLEAGTVAMFGAILLLLLSRVELHDILAEVEWPTIFFFVGLFVLVGGLEEIGLLDRIARRAVALTGGDVTLTALILLWFAGVTSAIVDNIPAVATLIPLTFSVARLLFPDLAGLDDGAFATHAQVAPLWWALALGACLGGNGSLVGVSANVVAVGIAERRGERIGFWGFTRVGLPFALVSMVVASLYVWLRYLAL